MSEKQTSEKMAKYYVSQWWFLSRTDYLKTTTIRELSKLLDQVRDEAIEECAKKVESAGCFEFDSSFDFDYLAAELRKLKSKGEAK